MIESKRIADHKSYKLTDHEVVKRVLNGEKELYEVLLRRYNQTLYRVVRSYLKDETIAQDVMQETYIKAWEKLNQFREEASFSTWLIRIGIHEALMQLRKDKKNQFFTIENDTTHHSITRLTDTKDMNPEKKTIQWETRRFLEQAIERLPQKYRSVYILREIEGLDNYETAKCLQISESNTKVRLHRARSLLKEALYELTGETEVFEFGNTRCNTLVDKIMNSIL